MPHWFAVDFVIFALGVGAGSYSSQCREALQAGLRRSAFEAGVLCAMSATAALTAIVWL
jgi:hypothetical protein